MKPIRTILKILQRARSGAALATALAASAAVAPAVARAEPKGFLETVRKHTTRTSTVTDNGDLNPYAVIVAPVSAGKIHEGDVLIDNFNNLSNLQGTGTTIVAFNPTTRQTTTFAKLPQHVPDVPVGVGLTTAMTMLKAGWVIVGSLPSTDGTTRTKGDGCLFVLDPEGKLVATWKGPNINGPWGNVATIDNGKTATLFVSMAGFDVPGPEVIDPKTHYPVTINKAKVLRLELNVPDPKDGKPPEIKSETVIADGLNERANRDTFLTGPTGLALAPDGTLYVSDAVSNQILAIPEAATRTTSAGMGRSVTKGELLKRPLSLLLLPNGHLLTCNGQNGQMVEVDPTKGKQIYAQWMDTNQAQTPPGSGDLFGMALTPDGKGLYYVEDDVNTLMEAR